MATPIDFEGSNLTLTGPQGADDPDVLTIRARRLEGTVVTCWQFTDEEIAEIIASGGKAWLSTWGHSMAPAYVTGHRAEVI